MILCIRHYAYICIFSRSSAMLGKYIFYGKWTTDQSILVSRGMMVIHAVKQPVPRFALTQKKRIFLIVDYVAGIPETSYLAKCFHILEAEIRNLDEKVKVLTFRRKQYSDLIFSAIYHCP